MIITFALCTIPDERKAASEAYRVLRPGGRFVLLLEAPMVDGSILLTPVRR